MRWDLYCLCLFPDSPLSLLDPTLAWTLEGPGLDLLGKLGLLRRQAHQVVVVFKLFFSPSSSFSFFTATAAATHF